MSEGLLELGRVIPLRPQGLGDVWSDLLETVPGLVETGVEAWQAGEEAEARQAAAEAAAEAARIRAEAEREREGRSLERWLLVGGVGVSAVLLGIILLR